MGYTETGLSDCLNSHIEPQLRSLLTNINQYLLSRNIKTYVVGGLVRDLILGRETADIDLAVDEDALKIAAEMADTLNGRYVLLDKENRTGRIVLVEAKSSNEKGNWEIDITRYEGCIEQDLARRDFTLDAMAIDLSQLAEGGSDICLVDPYNGWDDLKKGVIRSVDNDIFVFDAARLLRAVRVSAELGFSIEQRTEDMIRRDAYLVSGVAGERLREELMRILYLAPAEPILLYLDSLGLLIEMFPELAITKGVGQPKEHFWDVFEHSIKTVSAVEFLLRQTGWQYTKQEILTDVPWSPELVRHFNQIIGSGVTRGVLLKLAALLHDVAKPQAKTIDTDGRIRFLGHAQEGAVIVADVMKRLRFGNKEVRLVEMMVKHHLRPGQMAQGELPTKRAIYRYFRDTEDAGIDILFLNLADHLATRGPNLIPENWQEHVRTVNYILRQHQQEGEIIRQPKLIDGHDLINIFALSPGPEIRAVLESVHEAWATGEITTRQQALDYVRDFLLSKME